MSPEVSGEQPAIDEKCRQAVVKMLGEFALELEQEVNELDERQPTLFDTEDDIIKANLKAHELAGGRIMLNKIFNKINLGSTEQTK